MKYYSVFDIGGTAIKCAIIDEEGNIKERSRYTPDKENFKNFLESLIEKIKENRSHYEIEGIAISAPGGVDSKRGVIEGASALPCIHGPNFKELITQKTGLQVSIANDANCAALGEVWMGAGKDNQDIAFVICGSGIGGALVKDKRVHVGANKHGGELGYTLMMVQDIAGHYELKSWSTGGSIVEITKEVERAKGQEEGVLTGEDIFRMADAGDVLSQKGVDAFFYRMALGIINLQYTYDPEKVILGGAISERKGFIERIDEEIDKRLKQFPICKVKPVVEKCHFNNGANLIGALYYYLQEYEELKYRLRMDENPFVPSQNNRARGPIIDIFPMEYSTQGASDCREDYLMV